MAAKRKLSDVDVKRIRRRADRGESLTDLARLYEVNRKTLRRRIDALNQEEVEQAERTAATRRRRQATRERRKLLEREGGPAPKRPPGRPRRDATGEEIGVKTRPADPPRRDPYLDWLNRPKNLSHRALSEARGLVRLRNPEGTIQRWFEREKVDAMLEDGWCLA